jgi:hypothetical protein
MPSRRLTFPAVAVLAIVSLALGVIAALADGRDAAKPRPPAARVAKRAVIVRHEATPRPSVVYAAPCTTSEKPPAVEPVPQNLLNAFGVLRRDPAAGDALPDAALRALRDRGLEPFDPAAARLLRTTDTGGRAWVVPVRDTGDPGVLGLRCVVREVRAAGGTFARPARPVPVPVPVTPTAPTVPQTEPPPVPAPAATVPTPATPNTTNKPAPHPGLAVVALDGAPAGAGGRLEDLVRGREPVAMDPCGGPNRDMLSVSGIVPDGVGAAFLTSPDGTAIRADVQDNAYAFVVPRTNRAEQRYVVWTGGDGTPHVQPLGSPVFVLRVRCAKPSDHQPPVVSPDGSGLCGHFSRSPAIIMPAAPRTPVPSPPPLLYRAPCALAPPIAHLPSAPPTIKRLPKSLRAPKHHG